MNAVLAHDAAHFADALREEGKSFISPGRFADRLHISLSTLAEFSGVHRTTLQRSPDAERAQQYMRDAIGVIGLILDLNGGNVERAVYWYRNTPLTELGGQTAEQYVTQGKAKAIRDYVQNLAAGATG